MNTLSLFATFMFNHRFMPPQVHFKKDSKALPNLHSDNNPHNFLPTNIIVTLHRYKYPVLIMLHRKKSDAQLQRELTAQLGHGPMRFGPVHQECSVQMEVQARGLSEQDVYAFASIKAQWEVLRKKEASKKLLTNEQILRIALFCNFDEKRSLNLMKRVNPRHFRLSAIDISTQLESRTLFPCPGLKTSEGNSVFYMRPARYFPKKTPTSVVIDNLIFVMDKMSQQNNDAHRSTGISFIANMEGWTMSNFSYEYCRRFMMTLQGRTFPVRIDLFLIMNPPSWFGKVWAIMKPMLSPSFRKKVFIITEDELPFFMSLDYEKDLPDDIRGGQVNTEDLVRDYVMFHQSLERATMSWSSSNLISRILPTGVVVGTEGKFTTSNKNGHSCRLFTSWRSWGKKNRRASMEGTESSDADSSLRLPDSSLSQ